MLLQPDRSARKQAVNRRSVRNRVPAAMLAGSTLAYLARTIAQRYGVSVSLAATIAELIGDGVRP